MSDGWWPAGSTDRVGLSGQLIGFGPGGRSAVAGSGGAPDRDHLAGTPAGELAGSPAIGGIHIAPTSSRPTVGMADSVIKIVSPI